MPATFCLRLACGLIATLLVLSPRRLNPRFCRAHFLIALGLAAGAAVFLPGSLPGAGFWLWAALIAGMVLAFLGSLAWSLEGAPGGRALAGLTALCLAVALGLETTAELHPAASDPSSLAPRSSAVGWALADQFSSAALLGGTTTAMLVGHSYLTAPALSLTPLLRSLYLVFTATLIRAALAGMGLGFWTSEHSLAKLDEVTLLLPLRWGLGLLAPLVLGAMAWQTARIRSTQSATGILYVVVIFVFLGELIGQLLTRMTGFIP